jgi:hypothetical protein
MRPGNVAVHGGSPVPYGTSLLDTRRLWLRTERVEWMEPTSGAGPIDAHSVILWPTVSRSLCFFISRETRLLWICIRVAREDRQVRTDILRTYTRQWSVFQDARTVSTPRGDNLIMVRLARKTRLTKEHFAAAGLFVTSMECFVLLSALFFWKCIIQRLCRFFCKYVNIYYSVKEGYTRTTLPLQKRKIRVTDWLTDQRWRTFCVSISFELRRPRQRKRTQAVLFLPHSPSAFENLMVTKKIGP